MQYETKMFNQTEPVRFKVYTILAAARKHKIYKKQKRKEIKNYGM